MIGLILATAIVGDPSVASAALSYAGPMPIELTASHRDHDAFCAGMWSTMDPDRVKDTAAVLWVPAGDRGGEVIICERPTGWTGAGSLGVVSDTKDSKP